MTNEKLIEEARTFASSAPLGKTVWRELDKAILLIRRMSDALEAAEKAHTPTDDERIVRASIHGDVVAIRALGRLLRRTEVPEPSTKCTCPNTLGWHSTDCPANRNTIPEPETSEVHAYPPHRSKDAAVRALNEKTATPYPFRIVERTK